MKLVAIELKSSNRSYEKTLDLIDKELMKISNELSDYTLVVLPENFLGYAVDLKSVKKIIEDIFIYKILDKMKLLAKKYNVFMVMGSIPTEKLGHYYITSIFLSNKGEILAKYNKNHLFCANVNGIKYSESSVYTAGKKVVIVKTPFALVGLSVCFDLRFPLHFMKLRKKGASIIVVPSAFTASTGKKHWELLLRTRALENQSYIIGANLSGQNSNGYECYGHSLIADPNGEILAIAEKESEIQSLSVNVDLNFVDDIRHNMPLVNK
jgi:deaminated glutathione amidase